MEIHAEYFLKCSEAAKWLNTPQPVTGVAKEFLDGAHSVTTTIAGVCRMRRASSEEPSPCVDAACAPPRAPVAQQRPIEKKRRAPAPPSSKASRSSARCAPGVKKPLQSVCADRDVGGLTQGFPDLFALGSGSAFPPKSLLYVPVELHEHFVFGVALGCPVPPPEGVAAELWTPLVNRFVLDAGRKCCLMFSYFAEGSIVVSVDCFDEVGDHFSEVTFFEPTPVVGVFPRGIRGRMQIFEKRDCPACTAACKSCSCPVNERIEAIVKTRANRVLVPEHGPAHAGSSYKDENVIIQTYPYWAQVLDEYKWSRIGAYCVQIQYTPANGRASSSCHPIEPRSLAFRASVVAEPRVTVDKMLRVALFDKGVSALKPPATDVRWETSSTVAVNSNNEVNTDSDPVNAVCFTDWHKLPGFQEDYLLVAPSNIVSGAHARAELARAEAERLAARARSGVPVLPSWASGRAGVFEHILNESGPEIEMIREAMENEYQPLQQDFHAQMLRQIPQDSVGTVMRPRPRSSLDSAGRRQGIDETRRRASLESGARTGVDMSRRRGVELSRRNGVEMNRRSGMDLPRRSSADGTRISPRVAFEDGGTRCLQPRTSDSRTRDGQPRASVDSNRASLESNRKYSTEDITSPISVVPF